MVLPELFALVAPHLDPPSLVAATQVSRFWCACFTPILWSTIADSDWILPRFSPRQLYAHGHLVHSLAWDSLQSQPHSFLTHPSSLQSTSLRKGGDSDAALKDKDDHDHGTALRQMMRVIPVDSGSRLSMRCLVQIVARCTHLQRLKLNFGAHNGDLNSEEGKIVRGMVRLIRGLSSLQELELVAHSVLLLPEDKDFSDDNNGHHALRRRCTSAGSASRGLNVQWLIQDLTSLQSLVLRGSAFWFDSPSSPPSTASPTETEATSTGPPTATTTKAAFPIRHLSLEPAASALTEEALMLLVQQCPRLTSLDLPGGLAWEISAAFTTHLQSSCPRFESFSINASSAAMRGHSLTPDPVDLPTQNNVVETNILTAPVPTATTQASTIASLHVRIIPEDDRLATLIRGFTKRTGAPLRSFGARSCYFGNASLQALEEECPDLERLDLSLNRARSSVLVSNHPAMATGVIDSQERTILSKDRLVQYLKNARGLKELTAEGIWIDLEDLVQPPPPPSSEENELQTGELGDHLTSAEQQQLSLLRSPTVGHWVCATTLTHLVLGFSAINTLHHLHWHSSTILYTFLSSLQSLQVLKISNTVLTDFQPPANSPIPQSSSFHLLSALRDLREFDIETCSYSPSRLLNKDTIQWMVGRAWPRLESLKIQHLGVSQERELYGWLKEVGRDRLIVNGYCNRNLHGSHCSGSNSALGGAQENLALSSFRLMSMMMSY